MSQNTPTETNRSDGSDDGEGLFPSISPTAFKLGFYLFLILWLAFMMYQAYNFDEFEDVLFPLLLGVPLLILLVIQIAIVRFPRLAERALPDSEVSGDGEEDGGIAGRVAETTAEELGMSKREKELYEIRMIAWVTVLPFMMYYVGMGWTLIVYVFAFTYAFVGDLKRAVGMTVGVTAFVYLLFIEMLSMIIWTGEIQGIVDPLELLSRLL